MVSSPQDEGRETVSATQALRAALAGLLVLLGLQYLLGMWVNLYGSFPSGPPSLGRALIDGNDAPLAAHVVLALALLFLGLVALGYSWSLPPRRLRYLSATGLLALLVASAGGVAFVYSTYSSAPSSYLMAAAFLAAAASYGTAFGTVADAGERGPTGPRADRLTEAP
ncbi:MAG: hypothetical protein L3K13_06625 [Thermoplasmata archaeon]|nr:hypothetical protein [Thermoplasmata archaeon]